METVKQLSRLHQQDVEIAELRQELAECAGFCYQYAGATEAPVKVLDNLSDLAHGKPKRHEWPYPADSPIVAERDRLRRERAAAMEVVKTLDDNLTDFEIRRDVCDALANDLAAIRRDHPHLFEEEGGEDDKD